MKLLVAEPETAALRAVVAARRLVASALVVAEVSRAVARRGLPADAPAVRDLLGGLLLLPVDLAVLRGAGSLPPAALRTPDAVHLATALGLRDRLDAVVGYDARLLAAAQEHGLPVLSPGAAA